MKHLTPKIMVWLSVLTFLIIGIALFPLYLAPRASENAEANTPKDFNFSLQYGIGAKNILDTFTATYTKDLVTAGTVKTNLKLTQEEMDLIYAKMQQIDIFSYPSQFVPPYSDTPLPDEIKMVTPHSTYIFKIQADGKIKTIYWADVNASEANSAKKLREVINEIIKIVESKEIYKKLPPIQGGYD